MKTALYRRSRKVDSFGELRRGEAVVALDGIKQLQIKFIQSVIHCRKSESVVADTHDSSRNSGFFEDIPLCIKRKTKRPKRDIQMRVVSTIALVLTLAAIPKAFGANDLPRKAKTPRETYPNVDVIYDSVTTPRGERLRTIITKPHEVARKTAGDLRCRMAQLRHGRSASGQGSGPWRCPP